MAGGSYCYYTPEKLAICVLQLIPNCKISTVIDICCGDGALLKASREVFPESELVGVDVIFDDFYKSLIRCSFSQEDGFKYIKSHKKTSFDLVLSNPPFGRTESIFKGVIKELNRKRLECQMIRLDLIG